MTSVVYTKTKLEQMTTPELWQLLRGPYRVQSTATIDRIFSVINQRDLVSQQISAMDYDARRVAKRQGVELVDELHVLVQSDGETVSFYCPACQCRHVHGTDGAGHGAGHRVAHCFTHWSPFREKGYALVQEVEDEAGR
jgi:hypothetical protein